MRDAFFSELLTLFKHDKRGMFLTGDLGYKLFDPLTQYAPERVMNCGIREAGMVGYAAGLAKTGMLPFVYSIVPFITLRCLEQIKIDLCYNRNRVIIVGVGGGVAYGPNASTHHGVDDIGALSCLPGITIWTPADPQEVRACVREAASLDGPAYLRLGRNNEPAIDRVRGGLEQIDQPLTVVEGDAGVIVTSGFILHEVLQGVEMLKAEGINPRVVRVSTLQPFPYESLKKLLLDGKPVLSVEEHVVTGGLGQHVAVMIAAGRMGNPFAMAALPLKFPETCMGRKALLKWAGLDPSAIATAFRGLSKP